MTVTSLGSGLSTSATVSLTVTANVAIGEIIFIAAGYAVNSGTETITFSDSGVNSWTTDQTLSHPTLDPGVAIGRSVVTVALTSGVSTLTATDSALPSNFLLCAFKLDAAGVIKPIATDGGNKASSGSSGTSATPGSVTPTNIPDFVVQAFCSNNGGTGTPNANYTEMFDFKQSVYALQFNYRTQLTAALTALNDAETLSIASDWVGCQEFYKATAVGGAPARDTHIAIPFVGGAGGGPLGGAGPH